MSTIREYWLVELTTEQLDAGRAHGHKVVRERSRRMSNVIMAMLEQGHSQTEIARSLDMTRSNVSRIVKKARE